MKITVLTENTISKNAEISKLPLQGEHGLSLFIQTQNKNILFDMGQTNLFAKNASLLGINLQTVDFAILSHGHYDHLVPNSWEIDSTFSMMYSLNSL